MIVTTDNQHYQDIAGAIRKLGEVDTTYYPAEMADAILLASVRPGDLWDIDLTGKEEAYFLYDAKLDTAGVPKFVSLWAQTDNGAQYTVSRGHVESGEFVADSSQNVNSGAAYTTWLDAGDGRYALYQLKPQTGSHITRIGQRDSAEDDGGDYYAYFQQPQIARRARLPEMTQFSNWRNNWVVKEEDLDFLSVTSLQNAWNNCASLTSLNLSGWDTGAVTSLQNAWSNCASLTSLNLSGWDTGAVTSLQSAWSNCASLTSLNLSGWDTGAVTTLQNAWNNCQSLTIATFPAIYKSFSVSNSGYLTIDSLVGMFNALPTVTEPTTVTIGSTNQAKLTEEQIQIATGKGWTVA